MIVCKQCGHHNEDSDTFCGSCGKFLEWTGERVVVAQPEPEPPAPEPVPEPAHVGLIDRVKHAVGIEEVAPQPAPPPHPEPAAAPVAAATPVAAVAPTPEPQVVWTVTRPAVVTKPPTGSHRSLAFPLRVTGLRRAGASSSSKVGSRHRCVNGGVHLPVDAGGDAVGTVRHVAVDAHCTQLWTSLLMIKRHA